ncbi:Daunorubicin/doxorubicin resistance ATP-binding protein DrrA [Micromonospora sp. MW-13]|uniref:ABC transporter ATP-binding protein n=1 Tax=Micromonospora sp. MW-13 TaxID=2094022 RepID=UPI000E450F94|nr:ABC transporter ATP-binding protein [Micromonospora sp. MW-13]RGC65837.1 Daunorubicin/doxorubicin resistance ATP-binding protein DrrA [Micromonospora sp. MW-13]
MLPSRAGPAVVEVHDLVKRYPRSDANAVDGLSFAVAPGEIFGLFGPNGAGKSTTVGILTTRLRATGGRALVGGVDVGRDPATARAQLAVVPQHNNLDRALTPRQNLVHHATYHGVSRREAQARAAELLDRFGLAERADRRIEAHSGGMAQRLMIARALTHEPLVLFLDEPTNALDPQTRLLIWGQIRRLRERGVAIVLTTHAMNEAARVVDRVGIVDHGRLLTCDTPENLVRGLAGDAILDLTVTPAPTDDPDALRAALGELDGVRKAERLALPAGPADRRAGAGLPGGVRAGLAGAGGGAALAALAARAGGGGLAALAGAGRLGRNGAGTNGGSPVAGGRGRLRFRLHLATDPAALLGPAVTVLAGRSAAVNAVDVGEPSLEDVFIELTGREPR